MGKRAQIVLSLLTVFILLLLLLHIDCALYLPSACYAKPNRVYFASGLNRGIYNREVASQIDYMFDSFFSRNRLNYRIYQVNDCKNCLQIFQSKDFSFEYKKQNQYYQKIHESLTLDNLFSIAYEHDIPYIFWYELFFIPPNREFTFEVFGYSIYEHKIFSAKYVFQPYEYKVVDNNIRFIGSQYLISIEDTISNKLDTFFR
jgi:hypothetical protein